MSLVLAVAAILRFWNLNHPNELVFDEVHFVGQARHYLHGETFLDPHPPLAKILIALGIGEVGLGLGGAGSQKGGGCKGNGELRLHSSPTQSCASRSRRSGHRRQAPGLTGCLLRQDPLHDAVQFFRETP